MKTRKIIMLIAPLAMLLSIAPGSAHAARRGGACRQDIEKLCPDVKPGGGAYRDCLKQHAADLSPACQDQLKHVKANMAAWRQACQSDVQQLCGGVDPGRGNIIKCLHQHQEELSQTCKDQLAQQHRHPRRAGGGA